MSQCLLLSVSHVGKGAKLGQKVTFKEHSEELTLVNLRHQLDL